VRNVPRAFFWIDQNVIRGGFWTALSIEARVLYVALAASADRDGVSRWGPVKLMELSGIKEPAWYEGAVKALVESKLVCVGEKEEGIQVLDLDKGGEPKISTQAKPKPTQRPIVIQTVVTLGGGEC
jgi:hypothetical protein